MMMLLLLLTAPAEGAHDQLALHVDSTPTLSLL